MINIGNSEVINIYIGDTPATAVYIGDIQIWGAGGKDYSKEYFTLSALESGTFTWGVDNVEYSLNDGAWTAWDKTNGLSVSANDKVRFRSSTNTTYNRKFIRGTGNFDAEGNIMSLLYGDNFSGQTTLTTTYLFCGLFEYNTAKIVSARNLILPATTLTQGCYLEMFQYSTLQEAPVLPATTLTTSCYRQMFFACRNLIEAPELPASVVPTTGYYQMFDSCSNLNYVKCLATDVSASECTKGWLNCVSATGTFVKDANMTSWGTGTSGIPDNWTVIDA